MGRFAIAPPRLRTVTLSTLTTTAFLSNANQREELRI